MLISRKYTAYDEKSIKVFAAVRLKMNPTASTIRFSSRNTRRLPQVLPKTYSALLSGLT